jgi:hypothetical protein
MAPYEYCGKHQCQYPSGQTCPFCKEKELKQTGALLVEALKEEKGKK